MADRIQIRSNGVSVRVRLTPKGGRDAVEGWETDSNAALVDLIAKTLGVSRSSVAIVSGEKARLKSVAITGDTSALAAKLNSIGTAA